MAIWTDDRNLMFTGRSGLQYHAEIEFQHAPAVAESEIVEFYRARGAVLTNRENGQQLTLTRGHDWVSKLSSLLPYYSERWPRQQIVISLTPLGPTTQIKITYDVQLYYSFISGSNGLTKEVRELRACLSAAAEDA